jgi:beta-glucosidase
MNFYIYLQGASDWFYSYPMGFKKVLVYIKEKYNNPLSYVMENGKYNNLDRYCKL